MTYIRSYSYIERELMHHYRDQLNRAESEEDIKKFFTQTVHRLLVYILDNRIVVYDGDAVLNPKRPPYYRISDRLAKSRSFQEASKHSDLMAVLRRFAEPAMKRHRHLLGHPEKTQAKIRHHS